MATINNHLTANIEHKAMKQFFTRPLLPLVILITGILCGSVNAAITEINRIIAVVDEDIITHLELEQRLTEITQQLSQRKQSLPSEAVLRRQVLEQLIIEHIQLTLAERTGVRIGDDELNQIISTIAKQNKMSLKDFRTMLKKEGIEFADFREKIRNEVIITRLRNRQVDNRVSVSPQEVDTFLENEAAENQKLEYSISHILIATPGDATSEQVKTAQDKAQKILAELSQGADFAQQAITHSDGQQALTGGELGWRKRSQVPTLFSSLVTKMQPADISDIIRSPSGFHIIKLNARQGEDTHMVRQTRARHILIQTNEITSDFDARTRLQELHTRILAGNDFAKLARTHSADKGSASEGGMLPWSSPGDMVPAFEEAMDKLSPGKISEPFQSRFGWHIVQVLERRDHDDTESYSRSKAMEALRQRKIEEEQESWLQQLRSEAYVDYRLEK